MLDLDGIRCRVYDLIPGQAMVPLKDVEAMLDEITQLQAIVDKLPVDARGIPVVPRIQDVFHPEEPRSGTLMDEDDVEFDRTGAGDWHYHKISQCYSTREAAEAAGGEQC